MRQSLPVRGPCKARNRLARLLSCSRLQLLLLLLLSGPRPPWRRGLWLRCCIGSNSLWGKPRWFALRPGVGGPRLGLGARSIEHQPTLALLNQLVALTGGGSHLTALRSSLQLLLLLLVLGSGPPCSKATAEGLEVGLTDHGRWSHLGHGYALLPHVGPLLAQSQAQLARLLLEHWPWNRSEPIDQACRACNMQPISLDQGVACNLILHQEQTKLAGSLRVGCLAG